MSATVIHLPADFAETLGDVPQRGDLSWQDHALCAEVDSELWFPEKGGSNADAKRVCRSCGVLAQCLAYALDRGERFGIWGGMSERERRAILKRRENGQPDDDPTSAWLTTREAADVVGIPYEAKNGTTIGRLHRLGLEHDGPDTGPYRWDREQVQAVAQARGAVA